VRFYNGSRLCAVISSYILLSKRRLISGLSFELSDYKSVNLGYIINRHRCHINSIVSSKVLWLVASQLGFKVVTVDLYP